MPIKNQRWRPRILLIRQSDIRLTKHLISIIILSVLLQNASAQTLHDAAQSGNLHDLYIALQNGGDINQRDKKNRSPIHAADAAVVDLLIAYGADIHALGGRDNGTALHFADLATSKRLLVHNADVNALNDKGRTPLFGAVGRGGSELVSLLIEHGADVNSKDKKGVVPLHKASATIARILLANGADVSIRDDEGATALHYAAARGDQAAIRELIKWGADLTARDHKGRTPLDWGRPIGMENLSIEILKQTGVY